MTLGGRGGGMVVVGIFKRLRKDFFFEKKEAKKLLDLWAGPVLAPGPNTQKFFASFFQKRSPS